jgi:hypothetical protein
MRFANRLREKHLDLVMGAYSAQKMTEKGLQAG